jgi:hypothetical protein
LYRIRTDHQARDQIAALPDDALESYAQVLGVLELVPWHGHPHNDVNPKGAVRQLLFGARNQGIVIYLILDDQLYVDVLEVMWAG